MADDRLPCRRSESIAVTRSDKVMFRPLAISFRLFQNASSRLTLVLWPAAYDRALGDQRFHDDTPTCCSKFVTSNYKICPALWLPEKNSGALQKSHRSAQRNTSPHVRPSACSPLALRFHHCNSRKQFEAVVPEQGTGCARAEGYARDLGGEGKLQGV